MVVGVGVVLIVIVDVDRLVVVVCSFRGFVIRSFGFWYKFR